MTSGKQLPRTSLPYLFLGSVAALFLEMTLIRWVSTEIRVFAYVQNLALIACFLGFGLGCYHAGKRIRYGLGTFCALAMIVLITFPLVPWRRFLGMISELLTLSPDSAMWAFVDPTGKSLGLYIALAVAVSTVFLLLLIGAMFPLGQFIGAALDAHDDAIVAYTVNLAGSLLGTWLLAGLSFMQTKPYVWFALSFLMILMLWQPRRAWIAVGGVLVLIIGFSLLRNDLSQSVVWSPYQKLQIFSLGGGDYALAVNNTGYMNLAHPAPGQDVSSSSYDSPFRFVASKDRVLIVGAGAGTDAASALRNGARQVDAVEIDPAIAQFGRRYHADHPYQSPAVHVIINDARNYMRTTDARYDVIIFGLLDSHTVVSAQTNMRVDNYVYTEESFREALRLLKPDGVLVLKFEVRPPWLWMGQRFDSMLTRIAGRAPVVYYVPDAGNFLRASVFMISKSPALWQRAQQPELAKFLADHPPAFTRDPATNVPGTSDDWPFVYHRSRTIPRTHLTITVILLVLAAFLFGREFRLRDGSMWEFFFLGAGFLCVETQMVSRCALYFGSTWLVNCFVISAALVVLVVANLLVLRMPAVNKAAFYGVLVASLVAIYFLPWATLPTSPVITGLLLVFAYSIPLLCAGVVFADAFRASQSKSGALGANLLGATFGGVAQNLSFILGLKSLLLVSAAFYAAACLSARAGAARRATAVAAMQGS